MKAIVLALMLFSANFAIAAGAQDFQTLRELKETDFYRLTCSETEGTPQIHVYVEVEKGQVTSAKLFTVAPARSVNVTDFKKFKKEFTAKFTGSNLQIKATFTQLFFSTDFELNVTAAAKNGFVGTFFYDDGDGTTVNREVKCGAVNYILSPNN